MRIPAFFSTTLLLGGIAAVVAAPPEVGPFFEPEQPFFQSQVQLVPPPKGELVGGNFVVRGILLPLPSGHCVLFDQELMRVAGLWAVPAGQSPVTLLTMAQISYADTRKKAAAAHPQPTGPLLLSTGMHPGVGSDAESLWVDLRTPRGYGDEGRGALPANLARFDGIELAGPVAILSYHVGGTAVREWFETRSIGRETEILRHLEIAPHATPLPFTVGAVEGSGWILSNPRSATAQTAALGRVRIQTNADSLTFREFHGELIATAAGSTQPQRVSLGIFLEPSSSADASESNQSPAVGATPLTPARTAALRWPGSATAPAQLASLQQNGLTIDRIATPDNNPWKRRVRVADLAFLTDDRAVVLGYDGDVWLVDGFADPALARLTWRRYASGLQEPLAILVVNGVIQVATKNGVVRLHDRDGNGEADWFENFNDQILQSQTTRSFPLSMELGPDGSTYVTQGGIVTRSGLISGGEGTAHTGAIFKISPDGRSSQAIATGAREPFVAVHPKTGLITATDQQGHFIPSSVSYLVRPGDHFGYPENKPLKLTPPLVWIPHEQDTSSSSEAWMVGDGMGPWNNRLLHLSYGTGRMFLISPDLDAQTPQGAAIPLDLKTDLPLLHARMNLRGDAMFLIGFQIWGTTTTTNWSIGRLHPGPTPIVTALAARSCADGVLLEFATPLDPESLRPDKVAVRAWNYQRSSAYGSGRYTLDGAAGTTPWPVGQVVLSTDRKSVFIHLPKLPPVMELELRHDFRLADGTAARGYAYFTIHQPHALDLAQAGFPGIDLSKSVPTITVEKEEPPTLAAGKALAESLGCVACHSNDGTTEGKVGPTWRRLFGSKRTFPDGASEVADELYLREKILDPQQKKMKAGQIEMPSYRGVLSDQQIESIILYIKSLAGQRAPSDA